MSSAVVPHHEPITPFILNGKSYVCFRQSYYKKNEKNTLLYDVWDIFEVRISNCKLSELAVAVT